jgi:hypothetical protein
MTIMATPVKKNAKGESLRAYNEMRQRLKEQKEEDVRQEKMFDDERKTVQAALEEPDDEIAKSLTDIKIQIGKALDEVAQKRQEQFKKLVDIEKAIIIETKNLEELYEITRCAESLTALVRSQQEQRENFEKEMGKKKSDFDAEMAEARQTWSKERDTIEEELDERKTRVERERKQEEEDYTYKLNKKRQAEIDAYEAKKCTLEKDLKDRREAFEKEFGTREAALKSQEKEFDDLRKKAQNYPAELDKAVKETEKSVRDKIELLYKHQSEILHKEIDGERKLHAQTVASLEAKMAEKDALIAQLTQKVNETGKQVQDIAVKAIDGASRLRVIREWPEKEREPQK